MDCEVERGKDIVLRNSRGRSVELRHGRIHGETCNVLIHLVRKTLARLLFERVHNAVYSLRLVDVADHIVEVADLVDVHNHRRIFDFFGRVDVVVPVRLGERLNRGFADAKNRYAFALLSDAALVLTIAVLDENAESFEFTVDSLVPHGGNEVCVCHLCKILLF